MTRNVIYQPIFHTLYFTLHSARVLNNVVVTTIIEMVEMVEILDGRLGRASKVCNKQFITLGHCEILSHFTRTLYFHSPSTRDHTDATREISCHISL